MSRSVRLKVARYGYNLAGHYRTICDNNNNNNKSKKKKKENTDIGIHPEEGLEFFRFLLS